MTNDFVANVFYTRTCVSMTTNYRLFFIIIRVSTHNYIVFVYICYFIVFNRNLKMTDFFVKFEVL